MKRLRSATPGDGPAASSCNARLHLGAMGVAAPLAINLAAIGEAAAFDSTDYKALVCVFLYGGNDYANTVVPYDPTNYALYHQIRAGTAGEDESGDRAGARRARADGAALRPVARCSPTICNTRSRRSSPGSRACSMRASSRCSSMSGR